MGEDYRYAFPLDLPNLGHPFVSTAPDGSKRYIFGDDALAEFTGYNAQVAMALARRLEDVLGADKALPKALIPFTPYFASFGWAEYVTATALTMAWADHSEKLTRDLGGQDYRDVRVVCKAITKGLSNRQATQMGAEPLAGGLAMLCRVWVELRAILAAGPELAVQAGEAQKAGAAADKRFEKFVVDALADIQASLGRIEPAVQAAARNSDLALKQADAIEKQVQRLVDLQTQNLARPAFQWASAWPLAVGAGVLSIGMWVALRHRP